MVIGNWGNGGGGGGRAIAKLPITSYQLPLMPALTVMNSLMTAALLPLAGFFVLLFWGRRLGREGRGGGGGGDGARRRRRLRCR